MPWLGDPVLRVDIVRGGTANLTVRLAGEIDTTSVDVIRRAIAGLPAGTHRIVLDLSRVSFCDAAGARSLVEARRRAAEAGRELIVRGPQPAVCRVLELIGAQSILFRDPAGGSVGGSVLAADAVAAACEAAVLEAIRVTGADKGNAQIVDPATGALRIVAQRGFKRPFLEFFDFVDGKESACGTALMTGTSVWVPDVARSPIFSGTPALVVMLGAGARAVASVPMLARNDGGVLGMVSVHCRKPTVWTERQRQQLAALAAETGRVLSSAG
jgi:anti-anti-sigma factor